MAKAIQLIIEDPGSRWNIILAWNLLDLNKMALLPCHNFMQFNMSPNHMTMNLLLNMHSINVALTLPFNITSFATLLCLITWITDKNLGSLIFTMGDAHIYKHHVNRMKEQISHTPSNPPRLIINRKPTLDDVCSKYFTLEGYHPQTSIKFSLAV